MPKQKFIPKSVRRDSFFKDELTKHKPLSREKEAELSIRIQNGDIEARNELALSGSRFAISVATRFYNANWSKAPYTDMEFISAGYEGLLEAADRFDESKGAKFITYAVWWIRQKIIDMIHENKYLIHVPVNISDSLRAARSAQDKLEQEQGAGISLERASLEIDETDAVKDRLNHVSHMHFVPVHNVLYIDGFKDDLADRSDFYEAFPHVIFLGEVIEDSNGQTPEEALFETEMREQIDAALELVCDSREQEIIRKYFGLGKETEKILEEIGEDLGVTRERVRQLKERALSRIRSILSHDLEFSRRVGEARSIVMRNRAQAQEAEEKRETVLKLCSLLEQELGRPVRPDEIAIETNGWIPEEEAFEILQET